MNTQDNITKQLRKGALDFIVLATLQDEAKYPRQIIDELQAHGLSIVEGTMYPLFLRLHKNELVSYEWREASGHPRKYYSLTDSGRMALAHYVDEWKKMNAIISKVSRGHQS